MSGLVTPFLAQVQLIRAHYRAVELILQDDADEETRSKAADLYMAEVLRTEGLRVYNAVMTMVAGARGIAPPNPATEGDSADRGR